MSAYDPKRTSPTHRRTFPACLALVAIFYFSEFERLKAEGIPIERALVTAAQNRLRPIAMTTIAAALALLPLALALGQGAKMQQPLAIAIISGLTVQMPLVLLIMPATFIALVWLRSSKRQ
jgi:multidrug efflux pump subunit AcrB